MTNLTDRQNPLTALNEADREFVLRLVLASGSLKDLALQYGVSYPTIRGRLDRVIEHLQQLQKGKPPDPMADLLAMLIERGELSASVARKIVELHRAELNRAKEN